MPGLYPAAPEYILESEQPDQAPSHHPAISLMSGWKLAVVPVGAQAFFQ